MLRLRQATNQQPHMPAAGRGLLLACLMLSTPCVAAPERPGVIAPLPVPRPHFENPALNPPAPAPVPSGPAASEPTPPLSTELPPNDPIVRLGKFTREEQREILRRCASEWDQRKREGTTNGMIWRDFLDGCLPDHGAAGEPVAGKPAGK